MILRRKNGRAGPRGRREPGKISVTVTAKQLIFFLTKKTFFVLLQAR
jgi:hypothetical protein